MNWMTDCLAACQFRELESTERFGERNFWNHFNERILEIQYRSHHYSLLEQLLCPARQTDDEDEKMMMNKFKLKDYRTVSGDRRTHSEPTQTTKSMKEQGDNQWWWLLADTQRWMTTRLLFQRKWERKSDYLVSHENMSQHSSDPSSLHPGNKQFISSLPVVWGRYTGHHDVASGSDPFIDSDHREISLFWVQTEVVRWSIQSRV